MLKAIVFDFDGVLADSEPLHYEAFRDVARSELGTDFDYAWYLRHLIGFDDRDALAYLLTHAEGGAGPRDRSERVAELCGLKQVAFERLVGGGAAAMPGAMELVDAAAARMPVAISSGATRRDIELILEGLGRMDLFETIVTADDVERSKPDPASYRIAAERLAERHAGLGFAECLAIEDTAAGIASAKSAGLWTLGVASTGPAEALYDAERV
ncbi:MAG: HAD family hydrolase, partial [Phycisphaeraceae bacterium]